MLLSFDNDRCLLTLLSIYLCTGRLQLSSAVTLVFCPSAALNAAVKYICEDTIICKEEHRWRVITEPNDSV